MRALLILTTLLIGAAPAPDRLATARRAAAASQLRADELTAQAAQARDEADRAAADERAAVARVSAAAAALDVARARVAAVEARLATQQAVLAERQAPAARLIGAVQSLARRPPIAAVAQPGSIGDLVHLRAVLGTALPAIAARAAAVRAEVDATRRLQAIAAVAAQEQRDGRARLEAERTALALLEARARARAGALGRSALSESDRALALGEQARDLVDQMALENDAAAVADALARLPSPSPRPIAPGGVPPLPGSAYRLPVGGRLVTGFGEVSDAGVRARGLTFAVADGARVVAPAGGIVRYAERFRSFGTIVILDHGDGWSTLVAGLAATPLVRERGVAMGEVVGTARDADARVTIELRRRGRPVDLLALIG